MQVQQVQVNTVCGKKPKRHFWSCLLLTPRGRKVDNSKAPLPTT